MEDNIIKIINLRERETIHTWLDPVSGFYKQLQGWGLRGWGGGRYYKGFKQNLLIKIGFK